MPAADRRVTFLIGANAKVFLKTMGKVEARFKKMGSNMERIGAKFTRNLSAPLAALGGLAGKAAIDFESAFAGVRKTVDASEEDLQRLRQGILDLSKELPTSAGEIAGVAEAAGQLGIQTDAILEFTKTMVMLGDTTDIVADDAAKALARIANIMQLPQDQFDEMGSTIVELGNNFATTESEIVDMSTRIAAAGQIANMSASDIFAISTALSSVGVRAESGGTAAQKGILAINDAVATGNDNLAIFAETAGMTADQFSTSWRDDAGEAFASFINGLGNAGDNATTILSNVGLNSERARAAFLSLANAGDLVNETIDTGRAAWLENIALSKEAEQRYKTFQSRLEMFRNRLYSIGVTLGDMILPHFSTAIDYAEKLAVKFENLSEESKKAALQFTAIAIALPPLIWGLGKLIKTVAVLLSPLAIKIAAVGVLFTGVVWTGQWFVDNWQKIAAGIKIHIETIVLAFQYMAKGIMVALKTAIDFILTKIPPVAVAELFGIDVTGWVNDIAGIDSAINSLTEVIDEGHKKVNDAFTGFHSIESTSFSDSFKNALDNTKSTIINGLEGIIGSERIQGLLSKIDEFFQVEVPGNGVTTAGGSRPQSPIARSNVTDPLDSLHERLGPLMDRMDQTQEKARAMAMAISQGINTAASNFLEGVGSVMAGTQTMRGAFDGLLIPLADMAIRVGRIAIAVGIGIEGIKRALQSLNPVAAIAAGVALITLGSWAKSSLNKAAGKREAEKREEESNSSGSGVPRMATGGIIPEGFPNDTYPAFLSSGERVIPAPKPLSGGKGSAGGGVIHNVVNIDGRKVWESMKRYEDKLR